MVSREDLRSKIDAPAELAAGTSAAADAIADLLERYRVLAGKSEAERLDVSRKIVAAEYAMDDDVLRERTRHRLAAWLALEEDDARAVAMSYDRAMEELSATAAMRRVAMVQSIFFTLPSEPQERLRRFLPESMIGPRMGSAVHVPQPPVHKSSWLKFWSRPESIDSRPERAASSN